MVARADGPRMAKRKKRRKHARGHGRGASKAARKDMVGKMSLGCLVILLLVAAWLIIPRVITGGQG